MSILIGHAVMDENGGIDGAMMGDQTGKEITTRKWYKRTGGWNAYLQPLDLSMAENAATYMRLICDNAAYGYSEADMSLMQWWQRNIRSCSPELRLACRLIVEYAMRYPRIQCPHLRLQPGWNSIKVLKPMCR